MIKTFTLLFSFILASIVSLAQGTPGDVGQLPLLNRILLFKVMKRQLPI